MAEKERLEVEAAEFAAREAEERYLREQEETKRTLAVPIEG